MAWSAPSTNSATPPCIPKPETFDRLSRNVADGAKAGYGAKQAEHGPEPGGAAQPGWPAACLPWLHARDVAMVGSDTANDVSPSGYAGLRSPVHGIGIAAMGLWLLDNCDLEELAAACARLGRWEFCLVVAPLVLDGTSGSPVNPLALL
jgi:kynurenine formamidase